MEKKLYTLLVFSENVAGILNQITAVFTRRQVNIESLNVSVALYKLSTDKVMENPEISRTIRRHDARVLEVNPTYTAVMLGGMTEDITNLYYKLDDFGCLLQYTRSGRIAITRSFVESVSEFLEEQEKSGKNGE